MVGFDIQTITVDAPRRDTGFAKVKTFHARVAFEAVGVELLGHKASFDVWAEADDEAEIIGVARQKLHQLLSTLASAAAAR